MQSFGAQFVEAHVNRDTGEIRVPRMLGVFSVGRAINARTLRSQLIGGMTMGLSMALHEESMRDPRFGHVVTQDLATYHISAHADVQDIDAIWLDEVDEHFNPMGSRGAGEIGIVGAAAAVVERRLQRDRGAGARLPASPWTRCWPGSGALTQVPNKAPFDFRTSTNDDGVTT